VYLEESGTLAARRRARLADRVRGVVERDLKRLAWEAGAGGEILEGAMPALESGAESPYTVAARIVRALGVDPASNRP
jgi:putative protein kinase ArgK-like GTPase of G3E family